MSVSTLDKQDGFDCKFGNESVLNETFRGSDRSVTVSLKETYMHLHNVKNRHVYSVSIVQMSSHSSIIFQHLTSTCRHLDLVIGQRSHIGPRYERGGVPEQKEIM